MQYVYFLILSLFACCGHPFAHGMEERLAAQEAEQLSVNQLEQNFNTLTLESSIIRENNAILRAEVIRRNQPQQPPEKAAASTAQAACRDISNEPFGIPADIDTAQEELSKELCCVCLCKLNDPTEPEPIVALPCNAHYHHLFHRTCMKPHFSDGAQQCPVCRKDFSAEELLALELINPELISFLEILDILIEDAHQAVQEISEKSLIRLQNHLRSTPVALPNFEQTGANSFLVAADFLKAFTLAATDYAVTHSSKKLFLKIRHFVCKLVEQGKSITCSLQIAAMMLDPEHQASFESGFEILCNLHARFPDIETTFYDACQLLQSCEILLNQEHSGVIKCGMGIIAVLVHRFDPDILPQTWRVLDNQQLLGRLFNRHHGADDTSILGYTLCSLTPILTNHPEALLPAWQSLNNADLLRHLLRHQGADIIINTLACLEAILKNVPRATKPIWQILNDTELLTALLHHQDNLVRGNTLGCLTYLLSTIPESCYHLWQILGNLGLLRNLLNEENTAIKNGALLCLGCILHNNPGASLTTWETLEHQDLLTNLLNHEDPTIKSSVLTCLAAILHSLPATDGAIWQALLCEVGIISDEDDWHIIGTETILEQLLKSEAPLVVKSTLQCLRKIIQQLPQTHELAARILSGRALLKGLLSHEDTAIVIETLSCLSKTLPFQPYLIWPNQGNKELLTSILDKQDQACVYHEVVTYLGCMLNHFPHAGALAWHVLKHNDFFTKLLWDRNFSIVASTLTCLKLIMHQNPHLSSDVLDTLKKSEVLDRVFTSSGPSYAIKQSICSFRQQFFEKNYSS